MDLNLSPIQHAFTPCNLSTCPMRPHSEYPYVRKCHRHESPTIRGEVSSAAAREWTHFGEEFVYFVIIFEIYLSLFIIKPKKIPC